MDGKRVALYCRVSTVEQSTDMQVTDLTRYAGQRGWQISKVYQDLGVSGSKEKRPALDELMRDATKRRMDIVLVWKFDRWARSTSHLLNSLQTFNALGIEFVSLQDACDTTTPYGKAMFTVISAMAELERNLIKQRVISGLQNAKARGIKLGRKEIPIDMPRLLQLRRENMTVRQIGKVLGISKSLVARHLSIKPLENQSVSPTGRGA